MVNLKLVRIGVRHINMNTELDIRDSLRFIKRNGKLILQLCAVHYIKGNPVLVWQDVPVVEEEDKVSNV